MGSNDKHQVDIGYLKDKSIQSFLLAIEVFNKPTIEYRLEGCLFFLHNAWELLLKAKLVADGYSIYHKDSKDTLSLRDAAKKIMTNEKDPVRRNLDVIISQRNLATHLFIPEYDHIFLPFISFNVQAYANKLFEYFEIDISEKFKTDFLSLFTAKSQNKSFNLLTKYGADIKSVFDEYESKLNDAIDEAGEDSIATKIEINFVRINKKSLADMSYYLTNTPEDGEKLKYINRPLDPNSTHTLTHKKVQQEINKIITQNSIDYTPIREPQPLRNNPELMSDLFTTHALDIILREYDLKSNSEYCYGFQQGDKTSYKYHPKIVTYIISLINNDPILVVNIKNKKR